MHLPRQLKQQSKILYHFNLLKLVTAEPRTLTSPASHSTWKCACETGLVCTWLISNLPKCLKLLRFVALESACSQPQLRSGALLVQARHCFLKCLGKVMERLSARIMRKGGRWVKRYFEDHQQSHIQQPRGIIALMTWKRLRGVLWKGNSEQCPQPTLDNRLYAFVHCSLCPCLYVWKTFEWHDPTQLIK